MKSLLTGILFVGLVVPWGLHANVAENMQDPNLSLVQVLQLAMAGDPDADPPEPPMTVEEAVRAMIAADPTQGRAIVAAAIVVAPGSAEGIVQASILAGVAPADTVRVAILATDGEGADAIIAAAIEVAPANQRQAITNAAVGVLAQTTRGIRAVTGSSLGGGPPGGAGGGGAPATAEQIAAIEDAREAAQAVIASIRATVTQLGFDPADVTSAVDLVAQTLRDAETQLSQVNADLTQIQTELNDVAQIQAALAEAQAEFAATQAEIVTLTEDIAALEAIPEADRTQAQINQLATLRLNLSTAQEALENQEVAVQARQRELARGIQLINLAVGSVVDPEDEMVTAFGF